jgi:hypothetical protein
VPEIIVALVAVSATAAIGLVGLAGLGMIWSILVAVVAVLYASRIKEELNRVMRDRDDVRGQLRRARGKEGRPQSPNQDVVRLQSELDEWKRTAADLEETRTTLEEELAALTKKMHLLTSGSPGEENILLATELTCSPADVSHDFAAKRLRRGTVIDILAESPARFAFYLFDSDNYRRYKEGRRNTESTAGKQNVTVFRERVRIPHGDEWIFLVEPQLEETTIEVKLKVTLVQEE